MIKKIFISLYCCAISFLAMAQQPLVSMPFELFGDHIIIKLQVNNSTPLDFIFDTGDGLTVLDIDKARELGMIADVAARKTSAGGRVKGVLLKHQKIEIEDQEIEDVEIYETSLLTLERTVGRLFDGIIGYDILKNYIVRVDYDQMKFELYDQKSSAFQPKGEVFPLKLNSYIPYIKGKFTLANGAIYKGDFFIDTGARAAVDLNTPYVNKNNLIDKIGPKYEYNIIDVAEKEIKHYMGRATTFSFGEFTEKNLPLGLSQAEQGIQSNKKVAGIIGNATLKRYNITYDYASKKIYIEPNSVFEDGYLIDASGLDFQYDLKMDAVLIHQVHGGTPGAEAGITPDAVLVEINGKEAKSIPFPELRKILAEADKEVQLKIMQGGKIEEKTLKLRKLI